MRDSDKMEKWCLDATFIPFLGGCFHVSSIESFIHMRVSLNVKDLVVQNVVLSEYLPPERVFGLWEVLPLFKVMKHGGGKPVVLEYEQVERGHFFALSQVLGHCWWPKSFASLFPFAG